MNDLTSFMQLLLANAVQVLRENAVILTYVNRQYEDSPGTAGSDSIRIPIASAIQTRAITPGPVSVDPPPLIPKHVDVPLDNWQEAPFVLTQKQITEIAQGQMPRVVGEAMRALIKDMANSAYQTYKYAYVQIGTPGSVLFGDKTTADAAAWRTALDDELCPTTSRVGIVSPAESEMMEQVPTWGQVNTSGTDLTVRTGQIGEKSGAFWFSDQLMPVHTNGSWDAALATKSATPVPADTQTFVVTGGTGSSTLNEGDVFTIAGHEGNYVIRNSGSVVVGASNDVSITVNPGLRVALSGGEVLSLIGNDDESYRVCLQLDTDAIAFASKPASDMDIARLFRGSGDVATMRPAINGMDMSVADPLTQMVVRLKLVEQHYQWYFALSALWGCGVAVPQRMARGASA